MKLRNKYRTLAILLMLFCLLSESSAVHARDILNGGTLNGDTLNVVETYTGSDKIVLYLKGVDGELASIHVQAGTAACELVQSSRLEDGRQPVETLIMLDNSLSIQKKDRKRISKIICNIIADRMECEKMAVAVFQESVTYLSDYTSDNTKLLDAVSHITWENSNTYFTDVLYDLISESFLRNQNDVYRRIIVVSDGMDHKSIGYTKDELYDLLKQVPIPIYTIGTATKKKNNNKQLANMFAISRITGAESFLLADVQNLLDIDQAIRKDREIVRLVAVPPDEAMDGSRKNVRITFASGKEASKEVVMPQKERIALSAEQKTGNDNLADQGIRKEKSSNETKKIWMYVIPAVILSVIAVAVAILLFIRRKRNIEHSSDVSRQSQLEPVHSPADDIRTQVYHESVGNHGRDGTVLMWELNTPPSYQIVLTDLQSPARSFLAPLGKTVKIGRKKAECNIVIDYDMSVSGVHCAVTQRDGKFYVTDLQSSNGTYVDGQRVLSETEIKSASTLRLGRLIFRFHVK